MHWLLNPRVWVAAIVLVVLGATHFTAYRSGKAVVRAARDKERAELSARALQAEQQARKRERQMVAQRQKLEERYAEDKRKAAAAAAGAQSELGRLRDAIATAPSCGAPTDPAAATRAAGASRLELELLGNCATALTDLAAEADRLETRVVGLQQYVKDVCLNKR